MFLPGPDAAARVDAAQVSDLRDARHRGEVPQGQGPGRNVAHRGHRQVHPRLQESSTSTFPSSILNITSCALVQ